MLDDLPWKAILSVGGAVLAIEIIARLNDWSLVYLFSGLPG